MNKVDVAFHIGYHKTASSWLQQVYFPAHPEIEMIADSVAPWDDPLLRCLIATSDLKFNSQTCSDLLRERIVSSEKRVGSKCVSLVSAERLSGYPMSGGYDSFRIAERIHSVAPEAKIIIVVREQTRMISSVYKQMVSEGYPGRFSDMLHSSNWKTAGFDPGFYEYDTIINRYHSLFGKHNVLILPYELMRADSSEFMRRFCNFLEVDAFELPQEKKVVNISLSARYLNLVRYMNHFRSSEHNPFPVIKIPDVVRRLLMKFFAVTSRSSLARKDFMTEEQTTWITDYYRKSNERMNELVGIDYNDYPDRQRQ